MADDSMQTLSWIVTFPNTHLALKAERLAKESEVAIKMIPVPRDVSSDCHLGMRVSDENRSRLEGVLNEGSVDCDFVRREAD